MPAGFSENIPDPDILRFILCEETIAPISSNA